MANLHDNLKTNMAAILNKAYCLKIRHLGPVVQKPINANPGLKINQGVYLQYLLPTAVKRWYSAQLYIRSQSWKTRRSNRNFHPKVENMKQKFTLILD